MKFVAITLKVLGALLIVLLLIALFALKRPNTLPLQDNSYFSIWKHRIESLQYPLSDTITTIPVEAGWAKVNITPNTPGPMAGYGKRRGKSYEGVLDSVFVRAMVFKQGTQKVALVSSDLLIMPPTVVDQLRKILTPTDLNVDAIYFGATHTHNSVGGWGKGISTLFFSGPYNPEVEITLAGAIAEAVRTATTRLQPVTVSYREVIDSTDINNRLVGEEGTIDPEIRCVKFNALDGTIAELVSYSAHATVLNSKTMLLSRDWPGILVDSLEKQPQTFGMYIAGAVGSMSPNEIGKDDFEELSNQANGVWNALKNGPQFSLQPTTPLRMVTLDLPLADPEPRITPNLALRPWLFNWAFGPSAPQIKALRIGSILFIGVPCDFSGELIAPLDELARSIGLQLIVTSFNGGYTGYVTHDRWYTKNAYETVTMNWYGPHQGSYYQHIIQDIIRRM